MSRSAKLLAFVDFVKKLSVRGKEVVRPGLKETVEDTGMVRNEGVRRARLGTLLLYAIKSCASQSIFPELSPDGWPITSTGLLYDREFMLVDPSSGKALSQKKHPRMALIKPSIDIERGILTVEAKGMEDLVLPLPELAGFGTPPLSSTSSDGDSLDLDLKSTLLCGKLVKSSRVSPLADRWFSTFLNLLHIKLCRLPLDWTSCHAHFDASPSPLPTVPLPLPGHVEAFWEDAANLVKIGELVFANLGRCRRCLMVGINQVTGERTKEPLSTLSKHRKSTKNGRVEFGSHMYWREDLVVGESVGLPRLRVGDKVSFWVSG
ncbi:hypothetical protein JCM5353_000749 [Sporobolomyces roseus]